MRNKYYGKYCFLLILLALCTMLAYFSVKHFGMENYGKCLSLEEVSAINLRVNKMIDWGVGVQGLGRNPTESEILASGQGHCGMYAYLFCKELSRCGAEGITYDLCTYDNPPMRHSVVEVKTSEGTMVFDPTCGVFYRCNLQELLLSGHAEGYMVNFPVRLPDFCNDLFWSKISNTTCYLDVRDCYDKKLLRESGASSWANFSNHEQINMDNVKYNENLAPNSVKTLFEHATEVYIINLSFAGKLPKLSSVRVMSMDGTGNTHTLDGYLKYKNYKIEFQLKEPVMTKGIEVFLDVDGDEEMPSLVNYNVWQ